MVHGRMEMGVDQPGHDQVTIAVDDALAVKRLQCWPDVCNAPLRNPKIAQITFACSCVEVQQAHVLKKDIGHLAARRRKIKRVALCRGLDIAIIEGLDICKDVIA